MWSCWTAPNRRFSLRGASLSTDRGDLRLELGPGRQIGAGAPQIGGDPRDVGIAEPMREARHHNAGNPFRCTEAAQNDLDQVGWIGQIYRAVEREVRPHRERLARVVVA